MRTWFSSDTHFGHANIIRYCLRPFDTVAQMDAEIIARWNAVVQPDDNVWHLGDFCFGGAAVTSGYLRRLAGRKHLIVGNHDSAEAIRNAGWSSVHQLAEVKVDGQRLVLCHYALRVWPRSHHGAIHLYGHSHGQLPGDRQSLDIGVDVWGFRPVGLSEILERLLTLSERGAGGVS